MSQRLPKLSFSATVREGARASSIQILRLLTSHNMGKFAVGDKGRKLLQDKSQRDLGSWNKTYIPEISLKPTTYLREDVGIHRKNWNIWHFQPDGKFFTRGICLLTSWACTIGIWSTLAQLNWLDKFTSYVINLLDLQYFCRHNPLFYHLNLIPCHQWNWQRNINFLVNIFVRHSFSIFLCRKVASKQRQF